MHEWCDRFTYNNQSVGAAPDVLQQSGSRDMPRPRTAAQPQKGGVRLVSIQGPMLSEKASPRVTHGVGPFLQHSRDGKRAEMEKRFGFPRAEVWREGTCRRVGRCAGECALCAQLSVGACVCAHGVRVRVHALCVYRMAQISPLCHLSTPLLLPGPRWVTSLCPGAKCFLVKSMFEMALETG